MSPWAAVVMWASRGYCACTTLVSVIFTALFPAARDEDSRTFSKRAVGLEGRSAGQHGVQHASQRPDVGLAVVLGAIHHLPDAISGTWLRRVRTEQ